MMILLFLLEICVVCALALEIKLGHVAEDSTVGKAEGKAAFDFAIDILRQNEIISPDVEIK